MSAPRKLYESDRCTLWLGDCRDVQVERNCCGLMATDPPYGVEWRSRFAKRRAFGPIAGDDGLLDVPAILGGFTAAILRDRHVYVFGYRPDVISEPMKLGATSELIWNKGQPGLGDLSLPWGPQHEVITFGVYVPSKANRAANHGVLSARVRHGSVLSVPRHNSARVTRHPTEKPVALMRQLIESSSVVGECVFDPFAGVGSTLVAAILLGRRAVGIEIDEGYANVAVQRVRDAERLASAMEAA